SIIPRRRVGRAADVDVVRVGRGGGGSENQRAEIDEIGRIIAARAACCLHDIALASQGGPRDSDIAAVTVDRTNRELGCEGRDDGGRRGGVADRIFCRDVHLIRARGGEGIRWSARLVRETTVI